MWMMVAIAAASAAPPEGVDPDDLDRWEAGTRALLDGPAACWDFEGRLEVLLRLHTPPSMFSRGEQRDLATTGAFSGRISQGEWQSFAYRLDPPAGDDDMEGLTGDLPVFPIMGRIDQDVVVNLDSEQEDGDAGEAEVDEDDDSVSISFGGDGGTQVDASTSKAMNLIDEILEAIDPASTTSYGQWGDDPAGVTLIQDAPLTDRPRSDALSLVSFFPQGRPHATKLDVGFPKRIKVGDGLVKATLIDPQLHLRGQVVGDAVLPALESVSSVFGVLGFTVGYEQKLTYSAAMPCTSEQSPSP